MNPSSDYFVSVDKLKSSDLLMNKYFKMSPQFKKKLDKSDRQAWGSYAA